ncbi:hypothetical protein OG203_17935 [Nocardia sp. NBC_01499]|uniref:hypothetical protein n=1 Tax=Nocardia sp. NBC_01499 TaxID=2903597 RepID=UPI0038655A2F
MVASLSKLLVTGFSALLLTGGGVAHADPSGKELVKTASSKEEKQAKAHEETWATIVELWCDGIDGKGVLNPQRDLEGSRKQMSNEAVSAYYDAYRISPLAFSYDPVEVTLGDMVRGKYAPPTSERGDRLRQWRALFCGVADFRSEWVAELKSNTEKYATKMRPGFDTDKAILALYDDKMWDMEVALKGEQCRQESDIEIRWGNEELRDCAVIQAAPVK